LPKVITHIDQVTSKWLTAVLKNSGGLRKGHVLSFEVDTGTGNWSESGRLRLTYATGSEGELPGSLFLKLVNTDIADDEDDDESFTDSEVRYYLNDYVDVPDAPLLRCYDAAFSPELQRYHILLDDVSESHVEAGRKEPTLEYGLALAEGLAALHAHWWGAERLVEAGAPVHEPAVIKRFVDIARPGAGHIISQLREELEPHWPEVIYELYQRHPAALIRRSQDNQGFTIIHGDLGEYNILVARDGLRPLYFIDRQPFNWSLTTWLGVYDLAYAIVLDWPVAIRRAHEEAILRHYHQQLLDRGIEGYTWQELFDDYRLCVAMGVYIATEYCRGGMNLSSQDYWLGMLQRTLTAVDDLDCRSMW